MKEWTREEKYRYLKDPQELKDLSHLRIFVDSSSVEIFVNDGDAVFTSRIFPTASERYFKVEGDTFVNLWTLKRAVKEEFLI